VAGAGAATGAQAARVSATRLKTLMSNLPLWTVMTLLLELE
jgi:hypothetical protein